MARYDQSDPINSTFRVDIAANYPDANLGKLYGVGLDSSGKLIIGAGQDGICGVLVLNQKPGRVGPLREVPRVDVMFSGEITDFGPTAGVPGTDFGVAGTAYYSDAAGNITSTWAAGSWFVGRTVEPDRLIVNVSPGPLAAAL
jgi:hypothetical protein